MDSILDKLSRVRRGKLHLSCQEVSEAGEQLAHSGFLARNSAQADEVLEQVAFACLQCAKFELAQACVKRLNERYPNSPRLVVLRAKLLEAHGEVVKARQVYTLALEKEPHQGEKAVRKGLISLELSDSQSVPRGVDLLVEYLDTYYNDAEAWSLLADTYSSLGLHEQALTALSHVVLLSPTDAFALQRHAETNYTLGNYDVSLKESLKVIEMCEPPSLTKATAHGGPSRRAALVALQSLRSLPGREREARKDVEAILTKIVLGTTKARSDLTREWLDAR